MSERGSSQQHQQSCCQAKLTVKSRPRKRTQLRDVIKVQFCNFFSEHHIVAMNVEPLEKRTISLDTRNGVTKSAPAVHKMWSVVRVWSWYRAPPDQEESQVSGAEEAWQEVARKVIGDLSWLLRLPCNVFWSQFTNDHQLHR